MLIAIEGIDGSGKGTQAGLLQQRLADAGHSVALLSFPRYADTLFGGLIGDYLNGRLGTLEQVHPLLASLLFAGDRFESLGVLLDALERHDVVILDRYVASNIAHQAARLPARSAKLISHYEPERLAALIERIEHGVFGLPRADVTILLDLPVAVAAELIARKKPRDYTEQAADLHEADAGYLESVRQLYLRLAEGNTNWHVIPVATSGQIRPIAEIADEILPLVYRL